MDFDQNNNHPSTSPTSEFIGVDDISFYYEEMLRSSLVELEINTPKCKILLKRSHLEKDSLTLSSSDAPILPFRRRRTDFVENRPESVASNIKVIDSPINGVFYRSASPQSQAFVKEGDTVLPGATLCIVEAMKVMNEIKAEFKCKVFKILAENGKPVSIKQPLFNVEPI